MCFIKFFLFLISKKRDIHYCTSLFSEIYFIFVLKSYLELLHHLVHHLVHHLLHQLYKILHQFTISYDNLVISQSCINTVFSAFSSTLITFCRGMFCFQRQSQNNIHFKHIQASKTSLVQFWLSFLKQLFSHFYVQTSSFLHKEHHLLYENKYP